MDERTMETLDRRNSFDATAARERCRKYRLRILEISQQVGALHMAGAYSCTEAVDAFYNVLMRRPGGQTSRSKSPDTFLMSKGHGCMIQYVVLEDLGVLSRQDLDLYCKKEGRLGCHPDYGNPGIEASTGSLGHGLSMAVGMAYAERLKKSGGQVFVVLSDGEMQEGSTWEALMMASSLKLQNVVLFIDNNDFQSLGRTSVTHPSFYPVVDKLVAFGWEAVEIDGHESRAVVEAVWNRKGGKPLAIVGKTVKGKGLSFMEHQPIWHYRAPNKQEYEQALKELGAKP